MRGVGVELTDREESPPQKSDLDPVIKKEFVEVSDHGSYDINQSQNNPSNNYKDVTTEMMHQSYYDP